MYVTQLTVPIDFQYNGLNCQALLDTVKERYYDPDRQSVFGESFLAEWDFSDEDEAASFGNDLTSCLDDQGVVTDPSKEGYSGVLIHVVKDERKDSDE